MNTSIFLRLTGATALGAVTTVAVLLLMRSLIEGDTPTLDERPPGATLTFLPLIEDEPPARAVDDPVKPPPPEIQPPPPPALGADDPGATVGVDFAAPQTSIDGPNPITGVADGDALPVVKVRPTYPASAQSRGIEGHVLVQFDIDELGRVSNVVVLEATPSGVFERAALKAVERFRYKPRVVNGRPVPVSGVQHLVTFELSG